MRETLALRRIYDVRFPYYALCTVSLSSRIYHIRFPDYARFPCYACQVTASMLAAVRRAGGARGQGDVFTMYGFPFMPERQ